MKNRWAFASPFLVAALGIVGSESSACNGSLQDVPSDAGGGADSAETSVADNDSALTPIPGTDAAVVSCNVAKGEDYIGFCLQKQILVAEHKVFDPKLGLASSWDANTGLPSTDGGVVVHDVRDDVAYAASLSMYAISAQIYGDTEIDGTVVTPDLVALAPLVEAELATLPASYDGTLYMRLRRFASGMRGLADATNGAKLDAIADAYGEAIYTMYFHALVATVGGDAGSTGAADAGDGGDGDEAGVADASTPPLLLNDGVLGVPAAGGGILYDVDQAASGALALVDLASRNPSTDAGSQAGVWGRAAASVMNHLYARARHPSGLYYADLITSQDLGHDALASVVTPNDALLSDTQASVASALMRMNGIVQTVGVSALSSFPFTTQAVSPLSGLQGVAPGGGTGFSLWDPTPTADTTASCEALEDASGCSGSGFFVRYLPSTTGLDNSSKTIRANALAFGAIHRSLVIPGTAAGLDVLPLTALFESQVGPNASFLSITGAVNQASYPDAVSATLGLLPTSPSFTAQADAYAIEALTEQWIGRYDCPPDFY